MDNVLIVVPDITRKAHLNVVLPRVLRRLKKKRGIQDKAIKIIIATGLHKPHTRLELKNLVGTDIFYKYPVITHAQNSKDLVSKGRTNKNVPVVLNKILKQSSYIVTIGLIEPHLYAGYSGGAKTVGIGLAGEATINTTHHPQFLDKPGTTIGSVEDNPFQNCLWEIIKGLPIKYAASIVNDRKGSLKKVFYGDLKSSFDKGVKFAKKIFEKKISRTFDAVICKVGPPKGANLYQASRAFNYILNVKRPIVKKGGMVLVCASLKDGFGKGIAEKRFMKTLKGISSPEDFIDIVKAKGCRAGEHRAYMAAKALTKARLGFIGKKAALYAEGSPFLSFPTIRSAVKFIKGIEGQNAKIYTSPYGLSTIISKK